MKLRDALEAAERTLASAGVDTPRVDAELLLAHVAGTTRSGLYADLDREIDGSWEPLPTMDPEDLDARREAIGLEPIAEYLDGARRSL